jgi:hypothetical protein
MTTTDLKLTRRTRAYGCETGGERSGSTSRPWAWQRSR